MQKILTPILSEVLVNSLKASGFKEVTTNDYPLVTQVGDKLLFVSHDSYGDDEEDWVVTWWDLSANDFKAIPYIYADTYKQAILAFNNTHQSLILDGE